MNAAAAPNNTGNWGPWASAIDAAERLARLRSMRAFVQAFYGVRGDIGEQFMRTLYWAESLEPDDLQAALLELDRLPARDRRKIEASYAALIAYKAQRDAEGR